MFLKTNVSEEAGDGGCGMREEKLHGMSSMLMRNAVCDAMEESEVASRSGKWVVKGRK